MAFSGWGPRILNVLQYVGQSCPKKYTPKKSCTSKMPKHFRGEILERRSSDWINKLFIATTCLAHPFSAKEQNEAPKRNRLFSTFTGCHIVIEEASSRCKDSVLFRHHTGYKTKPQIQLTSRTGAVTYNEASYPNFSVSRLFNLQRYR